MPKEMALDLMKKEITIYKERVLDPFRSKIEEARDLVKALEQKYDKECQVLDEMWYQLQEICPHEKHTTHTWDHIRVPPMIICDFCGKDLLHNFF